MTSLYEEQRPRILVVDDQEENLDLLEAFLEVHDYEVTRARNGQEALAQVAEEPPALILLDTHIPAPDGFQVCRRLKQNELSQSASVSDRESSSVAVAPFFGKPLGAGRVSTFGTAFSICRPLGECTNDESVRGTTASHPGGR